MFSIINHLKYYAACYAAVALTAIAASISCGKDTRTETIQQTPAVCDAGPGADSEKEEDATTYNPRDVYPEPALPEQCDGLDNNKNGQTDEGFGVGEVCSSGVGECRAEGVTQCSADQLTTICTAPLKLPTEEQCNARDDNCDGETDFVVSTLCADRSLGCLEERIIHELPPDFAEQDARSYITTETPYGFILLWGRKLPRAEFRIEFQAQRFTHNGETIGEVFAPDLAVAEYEWHTYRKTHQMKGLFEVADRMVKLSAGNIRVLDRQGRFLQEYVPQEEHDRGDYTSGVVIDDTFVAIGYASLVRYGGQKIFVEVHDKEGNIIRQRAPLGPAEESAGAYPQVAASPSGFLVAWWNGDDLLARAFDENRQPLGGVSLVYRDQPGFVNSFVVGAQADGTYVIAHPTDSTHLRMHRYTREGQHLDSSCPPFTNRWIGGTDVQIIPSRTGSFLLQWSNDFDNIALQRFNQQGIPVGDINSFGQTFYHPLRNFLGSDHAFIQLREEEGVLKLGRIAEE